MALNCLDDFILVRGACSETASPDSGLYFEDLPGVNLAKAAEVADAEKNTGVALAEWALNWGKDKVKRILVRELLNVVTFHAIKFSKLSAKFTDDYLGADPSERGIEIERCTDCRLLDVYIPYVNVLFQNAGSGTLKIIDGDQTTTFDFEAKAGQAVCITTHYRPSSEKVQIVVDNTTLKPNESTLRHSCFYCFPDYECECDGLAGAKITGIGANSNLSYGIQPLVNLECSEDRFFCEVAHILPYAVLYAAGVAFLDELLSSERINVYTLYGTEEAEERKGEWQTKVDEEIEAAVLKLPKYLEQVDSCCVECNSDRWVYSLP